jgi:nucleoside-diphosphate-sugar epimerase
MRSGDLGYSSYNGEDVFRRELSPYEDWSEALNGVGCVVHCAARVHVMNEKAQDPLIEFRRINVDGTMRLARQAAEAGVRRFVFVSSIKVNGESTERDYPFRSDAVPRPDEPYGVSKAEAEEGLRRIASESGMEVTIIRPPLVYGPGVKANFLTMMTWLARGIPLPLGAIRNSRSFVGIDNLVDLIVTCVDHPAAANETFLVSDGEDLSTTALLHRMGAALGKPACLVPVPHQLLAMGAKALGKPALALRLCGSLQVDISHTRETLGWNPPFGVDEELKRTAEAYLAARRAK